MPSPVGHSLIGLAMGAAYYLPRTSWSSLGSSLWAQRSSLALVVLLANLPDVDYLPGLMVGELNKYHHTYTHTLGWVMVMSLLIGWLWKRCHPEAGWSVLVLFLAASASHLLADWLTTDTRPPCGIMAFWPLSSEYFLSPVSLFLPPHKATVMDMFQVHNVWVILVEIAWCLPLLLAVLVWKSRSTPATVNPS